MKRLLLILICATAVFFISCNKENADDTYCYECKNYNGNAGYQDFGCMTARQWNETGITDQSGNDFDKTNCRKK